MSARGRRPRNSPPVPPGDLLGEWAHMPEFRDLQDGLKPGDRSLMVHGLVSSAAVALTAALWREKGGNILLLAPDGSEANRMAEDASAWLGEDNVELLLPMEFMPEPEAVGTRDIAATRLRVLGRLLRDDPFLLVASVAACERHLPPKDFFGDLVFEIRRGARLEPEELVRRLEELDYWRDSSVASFGTYAVRGGIVDFFGPGEEHPVRVEFFGDVVDGIRHFDPDTQRSVENVDRAVVLPAAESFPPAEERAFEAAISALERDLDAAVEDLKRRGRARSGARLQERIRRQIRVLGERLFIPNFDPFLPYFFDDMETIFDYLPPGSPVVAWNPMELGRVVRGQSQKLRERRERLVGDGTILPHQMDTIMDPSEVDIPPHGRPRVYLSNILGRVEGESPSEVIRIGTRSPEPFYGQWDMFREELRRWRSQRREVVVMAPDEDRARATREMLGEVSPRVEVSSLARGFELPARDLIVIAEAEIRGRATARPRFRVARGKHRAVESYEDLRPGDYVVHRHHGIGEYLGISRREVGGVERDYLTLRYAEGDRLYVPADSVDLIHKYSSGDGEEPRIYRLGGSEWARVKERVRNSVRDLTQQLLELYSVREETEGFAFPPDTPWQAEFEAAFPYEDTPDQTEVSRDIKRAMESSEPMDYLLCGDVGYGKTEVAFRAAFKAMAASKQVVFLVPTTVLAQQHYNSALERFAGWPMKISVLSRFRTPRQQEETIAGLRRGEVDMVIGTHRLLGNDVAFRDLGLIIVDEEHRFGVGHKEKLKELRTSVDVLTLSATPIPRTLHMALSGIRDIGMIETPPEDRLPVVTYVMEHDSRLVADAIHREMERGGRIFYVHNRVRSMDVAVRRVERMAPSARIGVAHGQMPESNLENTMDSFTEGDLDVLVCTTIIESGLDIPAANTLIVEDADRLGLAQLYQLRGRVGRSDRLAYAYLTYRSGEVLTGPAAERLHALREFTELGSGFRLAKRDLEIRGAGNVLGAEQHGFMLTVGFELYTRFLREAADEFRGQGMRPQLKPVLEIPVDAYVPEDYVPESAQRVSLYRRLGNLDSTGQLRDLLDEMLDRFGDPPAPVINLVDLARLGILAADRGVTRISVDGRRLVLEMVVREDEPDWPRLAGEHSLRAATRDFAGGRRVTLRPARSGDKPPGLGKIRDLVAEIPPLRKDV
ncbi:MAG: transcription-repair coupling factor [Clostridia bacterium]